jgi:hypothetical protein
MADITNPPRFKVVLGNKTDNPNQYPARRSTRAQHIYKTIELLAICQHSLSFGLFETIREIVMDRAGSQPSTEYTRLCTFSTHSIGEDQEPVKPPHDAAISRLMTSVHSKLVQSR